jgi:hypothetical protein
LHSDEPAAATLVPTVTKVALPALIVVCLMAITALRTSPMAGD